MATLTDAIQKLKNALQKASGSTILQENYDFLQTKGSELDSQWAFTIVSIANGSGQLFDDVVTKSVDEGEHHHLQNYPANALQAAWNVATILENINVESVSSIYGTAKTLYNLKNKGLNGETNSTNLLDSLEYLDAVSNNGVPHIIDDVSYKINLAINDFITDMKSIPQGRNLIVASKPLDTLSFSNMQQAAQDRIAAYESYLKLHNQTGQEEQDTDEPSSEDEDEDEDELEYSDTFEGPQVTQAALQQPEVGPQQPEVANQGSETAPQNPEVANQGAEAQNAAKNKIIELFDELEYFDTFEGPQVPQVATQELEVELQESEVANQGAEAQIAAKRLIIELFDKFAEQITKKLLSRGKDDPEQKIRCEEAIELIKTIKSNMENKSLESIQKYLAENDTDINKKFSENRSQTWFRKYISEPFKFFKTAVNICFKACGFEEPFVNDTVKKFSQFKEEFNHILPKENTGAANQDQDNHSLHQQLK